MLRILARASRGFSAGGRQIWVPGEREASLNSQFSRRDLFGLLIERRYDEARKAARDFLEKAEDSDFWAASSSLLTFAGSLKPQVTFLTEPLEDPLIWAVVQRLSLHAEASGSRFLAARLLIARGSIARYLRANNISPDLEVSALLRVLSEGASNDPIARGLVLQLPNALFELGAPQGAVKEIWSRRGLRGQSLPMISPHLLAEIALSAMRFAGLDPPDCGAWLVAAARRLQPARLLKVYGELGGLAPVARSFDSCFRIVEEEVLSRLKAMEPDDILEVYYIDLLRGLRAGRRSSHPALCLLSEKLSQKVDARFRLEILSLLRIAYSSPLFAPKTLSKIEDLLYWMLGSARQASALSDAIFELLISSEHRRNPKLASVLAPFARQAALQDFERGKLSKLLLFLPQTFAKLYRKCEGGRKPPHLVPNFLCRFFGVPSFWAEKWSVSPRISTNFPSLPADTRLLTEVQYPDDLISASHFSRIFAGVPETLKPSPRAAKEDFFPAFALETGDFFYRWVFAATKSIETTHKVNRFSELLVALINSSKFARDCQSSARLMKVVRCFAAENEGFDAEKVANENAPALARLFLGRAPHPVLVRWFVQRLSSRAGLRESIDILLEESRLPDLHSLRCESTRKRDYSPSNAQCSLPFDCPSARLVDGLWKMSQTWVPLDLLSLLPQNEAISEDLLLPFIFRAELIPLPPHCLNEVVQTVESLVGKADLTAEVLEATLRFLWRRGGELRPKLGVSTRLAPTARARLEKLAFFCGFTPEEINLPSLQGSDSDLARGLRWFREAVEAIEQGRSLPASNPSIFSDSAEFDELSRLTSNLRDESSQARGHSLLTQIHNKSESRWTHFWLVEGKVCSSPPEAGEKARSSHFATNGKKLVFLAESSLSRGEFVSRAIASWFRVPRSDVLAALSQAFENSLLSDHSICLDRLANEEDLFTLDQDLREFGEHFEEEEVAFLEEPLHEAQISKLTNCS